MMEAINETKIRVIQKIALLENADILSLLDKILSHGKIGPHDLMLLTLYAPVHQKTDLDALIQSQNYQGPSREHFQTAADALDIQEPIEALLAQLSR